MESLRGSQKSHDWKGSLTNSFSLNEKQPSSKSRDTNWGLISRIHKEYKVRGATHRTLGKRKSLSQEKKGIHSPETRKTLGSVVHTGNPSTQEVEPGGWKVLGQLELPREPVPPKSKGRGGGQR